MPEATNPADTLRDELRIRVGNPDIEELDDNELAQCLISALREINRDRPASTLAYFLTVADQPSYTVLPTNSYRVKDVFWNPSGWPIDITTPGWEGFAVLSTMDITGGGGSLLDNPASMEVWLKKLNSLRQSTRAYGRQRPDDGKVWLSPVPCASDIKVYYEYTYPRFASLAVVERYYEQYLLLRAEVFALEALGHKRSEIKHAQGVGGSYSTTGGMYQFELAARKLKQYDAQYRCTPIPPRWTRS